MWLLAFLQECLVPRKKKESLHLRPVPRQVVQKDYPDDPIHCLAPDIFTVDIPADPSIELFFLHVRLVFTFFESLGMGICMST
jgi:hypothetical protein